MRKKGTKAEKRSKFLQAAELFHVKLAAVMQERGLKAAQIARQMPGVDRQTVSRYLKPQGQSASRIPRGIHMLWLLQALDVAADRLAPLREGPVQSRHGAVEPRSSRGSIPDGPPGLPNGEGVTPATAVGADPNEHSTSTRAGWLEGALSQAADAAARAFDNMLARNELPGRSDGPQRILDVLNRFGDVLEGMGEDGSDFYRAARYIARRLEEGLSDE